MKVVLHPADTGGCGSYRMIWPGEALAAQGHDVTVDYDRTYRAVWQPSAFGDRIVALDEQVEADVVVLQRPLRQHTYDLIRALQAQGVAVVCEVDDDFHAIHPRNPAWKHTRQLDDPAANREWLKKSCEIADLVTVTTPALAARYGGHGRVAVLPNYVPERYLGLDDGKSEDEGSSPCGKSVKQPSSNPSSVGRHGVMGASAGRTAPTVVGWSGSTGTHPGDLEVTKGAVAHAVADSGARFHVVGTGRGVARALGLDDEPSSTGWLPIADYPAALTAFDIGLVPLKAIPFNVGGKSALKGLEYAAVGVAVVASPTDDYRRLHGLGIGVLADTPDDWYDEVCRLSSDGAYLEDRRAQDHAVAATQTLEAHADQWLEAWERARANMRSDKIGVA